MPDLRWPMLRKLLPSSIAASLVLAMLCVPCRSQPAGPAAPAAATGAAPTAAQAQQVLDILQNPQQRAQLIANLQTIATAKPAAAPTHSIVAPDSLGAQLPGQLSAWTARLAAAAAETMSQLSAAPQLWRWLVHASRDPATRAAAANAAWRIVLVLLCAAIAEAASLWLLRRPAARLEARAPAPGRAHNAWELLRRLPFALARLGLGLIPVVLFAGIGNLMAGIIVGPAGPAPLVAVTVVDAYAVGRAILCGGRMIAAPSVPRLRLLPVGDPGAAAIMSWLRRITVVAVVGSALAQIAVLLGLPLATHDAVIRLTALAAAALLAALVIASREPVARYIRGGGEARAGIAEWRRWLAEAWHYLALAAIVAAWLVLAGGIRPGIDTLDFLLGTAGVLIGARLLAIVVLGAIARAVSVDGGASGKGHAIGLRAARYHGVIRAIVVATIAALSAIILLQLWGADPLAWFARGAFGQYLVSALVTVALAAAVAILVWETANAMIDREIDRLHDAEPARSVRLRTLLPMMRTGLLATIVLVIGATALSEIGVNIAPLLAGAGIVGIAVGFGAQTLVHDIITGMFILIEGTVQVGDGVTVAGLSGTVEELSIRTLRLRAADGSLHIIPFSSVVTVTNTNRGIGNAGISITVAADQDVDRVGALLAEIAAAMRADPKFAPLILGDFDYWGVDTIKSTGVTLSGQIPCTVAGRMPVQREFNRRILHRFAEAGIALASP